VTDRGSRAALGLLVGRAAAWLLFVALLRALRPRDAGLGELVGVLPDIARLCRDVLTDRGAPADVRPAMAALLVYLVNPVDLIPEFLPVLGPIDDVVIAVLVLRFVRRRLGPDELRARWRGTLESFALLQRVTG
jgi:uncharacterized membrane protein YkvA (DUF1232 family)